MDRLEELLAHYDGTEPSKEQYLIDHLLEVSRYSGELGKEVGLTNVSRLVGLLHDFGKSREKFQLYITGKYKGKVDHSSVGGIIIEYIAPTVYKDYNIKNLLEDKGLKKKVWNIYKEIVQYPILAHHGLYDIIDNNLDHRTGLRLDISKFDDQDFENRNLEFLNLLNQKYITLHKESIYDLYHKGFKEFIEIYKKIGNLAPFKDSRFKKDRITRRKTIDFYYGSLVRLLLSILKEGDIYDSSNYYREDKDIVYSNKKLNKIWDEMEESIEGLYTKFNKNPNKSNLDKIRTELANEIYDFSKKHRKGAYKLDMPVGSGKTYAALRYAVNNCKRFQKKRIFYCTAFLSVLEQNAFSIREILGSKYILEHHSNIIEDYEMDEEIDDKKDYGIHEYLKESWESPVVLTTLVQLSNTLFKHKSSNIRRFSKLINSVLIIDEIQSLPPKAIYNFNLMTNFLTEVMNCTVVHSTATPPNLDNKFALRYPCNYGGRSGRSSIVEQTSKPEVFSRVNYYSLLGENLDKILNSQDLSKHIKEELKTEMSALVVLNTKRAVENLYNTLLEDSDNNTEIIYLTTNQCPRHRLNIIENMKERLTDLRSGTDNTKLICISTKLVEAGVDIDFDMVYRSLAGLDSIIQCGGRCNREGKKRGKGKLFILKYEDEKLKYLRDIQKQVDASEVALKIELLENGEHENIDIEKACDNYFHKLYLNEESEGNYLSYPIKEEENILNLLTNNPNLEVDYRINKGEKPDFYLKQSFKTAALNFELIKEDTISVIVQYENEELIEDLYSLIESQDYFNIKKILKKLQPYTISIRRVAEYERYITKELDGEILILSNEAYDEKVGLIKGELQSLFF